MSTSTLHSRRALLSALAGLGISGLAAASIQGQSNDQTIYADTVSVLAPIDPDPAPPQPGTEIFSDLESWQIRNRARVQYENAAVENIKAKILLNFGKGLHMHDVMYCAGWAPELSGHLLPIDPLIDSNLRNDLSGPALQSFRWNGKTYGLPIVSNPMILFGNESLLSRSGIDEMPGSWEDYVVAARAVRKSGAVGWTMAGGQTGGLGGLFTNWNLFFLQAGGELFDLDGLPSFANDSGIAAIEMLQLLLETADDAALTQTSLLDATIQMMRGGVGMMANWAVMYRSLTEPSLSEIASNMIMSPLPAGPFGTASVDSGDGWTIDGRTWVPTKAISLIRFYLDSGVQKSLYRRSGWLPANLTALAELDGDPSAPHATAVREQLQHRINSGFRPDYDAVSNVIGSAVRSVLVDDVLPIVALRNARDQLLGSSRR